MQLSFWSRTETRIKSKYAATGNVGSKDGDKQVHRRGKVTADGKDARHQVERQ